ncbi:hypothetical protein HYX13_02340 [Candidatus Woesearchaeota archaeon]|nr:hypothetical protein [Candidatus Woesearchaeota archaeon]
MINKRGAVFHWIVFGIIGALGIFLFFASQAPGLQTVKGTWQQGLLYDGFFPAEAELLEQDVRLQHLFRETAQEVTASGAFLSSSGSPCGEIESKNIWDDRQGGCFPDILQTFQQSFALRLEEKYPQYVFSEMRWDGQSLIGKSRLSFIPSQLNKLPKSSVLEYSTPAGFSLDASSLIEAYTTVSSEARTLLQKCRNERDATACITAEITETPEKSAEKLNLPHWKYASCSEEKEIPVGERKLPFCVQEGIFQFQLALDFTPEKPFAVDNLDVFYVSGQNGYELRFKQDTFAENYKIYYTDFLEFVKTQGTGEEVFQQVLYGFLQEKLILGNEVQENCPAGAEKQKGIAYHCGEEVVYFIDDSRLTADGDYVFGVTALLGGKESDILFLVKMEDLFAKRI